MRDFAEHSLIALLLLALMPGMTRADPNAPQTPRRGGTLRLAFVADWRSLDPAIAFDSDSVPLQKLLFRGLLDFDDGVRLVPDQAADWNISPDGKTYTFHLKPGIRFSNGREVEAQDYVFSFERTINPNTGSEVQTYFLDILGAREFRDKISAQVKGAHVAGLRAPDRHTFIVELTEPRFTFRYVLAMVAAYVVPRDIVQEYGKDFQYHMEGTGPYRIAQWRRGVSYHLERNPYYSGHDGYVDAVDIMIGGDPTLHAMLLERDELDRAPAPPADVIRFQRDPLRRSWLQRVNAANTDYFFMNTELKPFDDVRVRRAVSCAVDVDRILKLTRGFGVAAQQIIPPSMPWSNPGLHRHECDPEKARQLLRDAGFPDGFKTQLWYQIDPPLLARLAQGIQQDLHRVGIDAQLNGVNSETFIVKSGSRRQVPCGVSGWYEDYPDPSDFLDVMLNGERITDSDCNNLAFYSNQQVTALLNRANSNMDAALRTQLFRDAEVMVMRDAPWVPILHEQMPRLNNPRLHGIEPHPVWLWRYERMWLDK